MSESYWPSYERYVAMGRGVRDESVLSEAREVAKLLVERAVRNCARIHRVLTDLGYEFEAGGEAFKFADLDDMKFLTELKESRGPIPLVLEEWFARVTVLDFRQSKAQCFDRPSHPLAGLGFNASAVYRLHSPAIERALDGDELACRFRMPKEEGLRDFHPTGAVGTDCAAKGVWIPNPEFDAAIADEGDGPVRFMEELRYTLEAGGFPFWQLSDAESLKHHTLSPIPDWDAIVPKLTEGLEPL